MRVLILLLILCSPLLAQPLTLEQARTEAVDHSPLLRSRESRVREAGFAVDEASSGGLPRLTLEAGSNYLTPTVGFTTPNGVLPITESFNYSVGLTLEQAIFTFGRLHWSKLAAELTEKARLQEQKQERQRVLEEVELAYLDLDFGRRAVKVAERDLATREAHLSDAQLRLRGGLVAPFEVMTVETEVAQARQGRIKAIQADRTAELRLLLLMGRETDSALELAELPELPEPPATSAEGLERALAQRPELLAVDWAVEAAQANLKYEESQNNPSLGFRSTYARQNSTAFQPNQLWVAGVQLSIPLFDGGVTASRSAQAREKVSQLEAGRQQLRRQLTLQVEKLFGELKSNWESVEVARTALRQSDEALRLAQLRYRSGVSTNLELLQAETANSQARLNLHQSEYAFYQTHFRWQRATVEENQP